jgi:hypothetical protein
MKHQYRYSSLVRGKKEDDEAAAAAAPPPPPPPRDSDDAEPSCADVCCLPRDANSVQAMDNWQAVTLLTLTQVGVNTIVTIEVVLHIIWIMLDLVPGFALYDGPVGSVSAYTHTGWWMAIDLIVIAVGAVSVYFGLSYVPAENVVERGLARNENWIIMYMIMLGIGVISLLVHAILSLFEVASCTSTLCVNNQWVLIGFIVGLFIDAFVLGLGILRAYSFQRTLKNVMVKWNVLLVVEGAKEQQVPPPQVQPGGVAPSTPPENLLAKIGVKHQHQWKGPQIRIPIQYKMK